MTTNRPSTVADHGGWPGLLRRLTDGFDLTADEAEAAMSEILGGDATPAQIGGLLVALRAKGETVAELTGFTRAMLAAAEPLSVSDTAIDIVGTGGSEHRRRHALNVSTMASIVAASAGAVVCKHGNRKASSTSGSFDFLEAIGVAIDLEPSQLERCVADIGVGFAFARSYHPAMRFAGPVRIELGIPTVFNLLGPLANPGRLTRQVVGVASPERADELSQVLRELGSVSAWVVSGADGLDEVSTTGESVVYQVTPAGIARFDVVPADLGIATADPRELAGGSPERNVEIFAAILAGEGGAQRDIVVVNAGAGLVVAGIADTLAEGVDQAAAAIADGRASAKLEELKRYTNALAGGG